MLSQLANYIVVCLIDIFLLVVANVSLELANYTVGEGDGYVTVCASLEGVLERIIIVNMTTTEDSALGESLYNYSPYIDHATCSSYTCVNKLDTFFCHNIAIYL